MINATKLALIVAVTAGLATEASAFSQETHRRIAMDAVNYMKANPGTTNYTKLAAGVARAGLTMDQFATAMGQGGTRYNIRMDTDGLLHAGAPGMQLTWMDAKYRDWVVTPRMGKPVEIQALWFNALQIMRSFAARFGDTARALRYGDLAGQAELAFNAQFWNEEAGCLYDVVDGTERDASIRPNQIFAASLTHTMLNQERMQRVVDVVARDLLTPYGLRSLSPAES